MSWDGVGAATRRVAALTAVSIGILMAGCGGDDGTDADQMPFFGNNAGGDSLPPAGDGDGTMPPPGDGDGTMPPPGDGDGTMPPPGDGDGTMPPPGDGDGMMPDDAGMMPGDGDGDGDGDGAGDGDGDTVAGECCSDGDCLCHGPEPTGLTSRAGPYNVDTYSIRGTGCVYYPTDAEPPFAAVTVSDGYLGSGGCGRTQTDGWGPLYASWGIVTMIIETTGSDQPATRGRKLTAGVAAFKAENTRSGSPLEGKLAGRYGTSGFSMGGGGTSYASQDDDTLLSSVAIMPWGPVRSGIEVPTLVICGSSDTIASCTSHGTPLYNGIGNDVPKMRVTVSSGHSGQPTAGRSVSGEVGLAFQKVFLEGDERWRPVLVSADSNATNIQ